MTSILSTKKLSSSQKEMFLNENISYTEYDSILIELIDFNSPEMIKNAIFSSQNALKSIEIYKKELFLGQIENSFCVGQNVEAFLTKKGQNVAKMCKNARELSDFIIKMHKTEDFHYFCGDIRLDKIPQRFREENINLTEIINYKTSGIHRKFDQTYDGVLFFSPSAVRSYFSKNHIDDNTAICIGETTAKEVRKYTNKLIIANSTSVDSVINSSLKYLKKI
jgi:uroporphyrinogen-III synthase